ncbi:hypothetical protein UFOVP4_57 [uncultured Caudovirales phage]|uniref:Uncharacterized protein n=1 Tax=uncultured Caudovirales phage TaxID=2100421 RepID=A0A6J5TBF4_9CAUD|nr:hypothetical protein UFOVP4_57 [uncultured Caudovirales phage]CAB4241227.1 hypothetical protein UFOVP64_3 [uncultured Caudovirales phage]CAB5078976.1 hypothetical protein UFOVP145_17 [uncultured Caudovirales phage]
MDMKIDKLLEHATGLGPAESSRQKQIAMASLLVADGHTITPEAIKKWGERGSVPSRWLGRIAFGATKRGTQFNLPDYY